MTRLPSLASTCLVLLALAACGDDDTPPATPDGSTPVPRPDASPPVPPDAAPDATAPDAGPPPPPPLLRNELDDLKDEELAFQAMKLLGAPVPEARTNCDSCHGMTPERLRSWAEPLGKEAVPSCLTDLSVPTADAARAMIDCLRRDPGKASSPFVTAKLGVYASATDLPWFAYVFTRAYGDAGAEKLAAFKSSVLMPKPKSGHPPFTQAEFDIVAEWYQRGLPFVDELDTVPPPVCVPSLTAEVATHVTAMARSGWKAANAEAGLAMHGCAGAASPRQCLATYPRASKTAFGAGWERPGQTLRVLRTNEYASSFWTRSSADGRFVGYGGSSDGMRSTIVDLQQSREIPTEAAYDPAFFPDNSAFMFQGTPKGTGVCTTNLLTSSPPRIGFDEPQCSTGISVGLYQHVGASLGGRDYWTVNGDFVSDDGGHSATLEDPGAFFPPKDAITLTPMIHDGGRFRPGKAIDVTTPFEGDTVIAPSARLLIGRVAGGRGKQGGFRLRKLVATATPTGYTVEVPEIARYCDINGGKPAFSYDERWIVLHHYIGIEDAVDLGFTGPTDPRFQPYREKGAANLYLVDLLTGRRTRITSMQPGQYALFPHFRSDGWIYFLVRNADKATEHVVASDAALVLAE